MDPLSAAITVARGIQVLVAALKGNSFVICSFSTTSDHLNFRRIIADHLFTAINAFVSVVRRLFVNLAKFTSRAAKDSFITF